MASSSTVNHARSSLARDTSPGPTLERLVEIDTSNSPGREADATACLSLIQNFGFEIAHQDFGHGRSNPIGTSSNGAGSMLALNTHMDVVPGGEGWTRDRLTRDEAGGPYGRGTCDANGALAAAAGARLADTPSTWARTLIPFAVDEEVGSAGARAYAASRPAIDYAILDEPTGNCADIAHNCSLRPLVQGCQRPVQPAAGRRKCDFGGGASADRIRGRRDGRCSPRPSTLRETSMTVTRANGRFADNAVPDICDFLVDRRMADRRMAPGVK